jgi:hypothetical protein
VVRDLVGDLNGMPSSQELGSAPMPDSVTTDHQRVEEGSTTALPPKAPNSTASLNEVLRDFAREVVAISVWLYGFLKLFVFDIDRWFVSEYFPSVAWVVDYKFAFLLTCAAFAAIFWKRHFLWSWVAFILFYPVVVLCWRLPVSVIVRRNWTLGLALVALGVSAVRSFRVNFLLFSAFVLGTFICVAAQSSWMLVPGATLVALALLVMYVLSVAVAFKPTLDVFSARTLDRIWSFFKGLSSDGEPPGIPLDEMTDQQRTTWITQLQIMVLYNRGCYFVADKLRELKRSNLNVLVYIFRLLLLFAVTVWTFYLLNLSLFKLNPSSFSVSGHPTGFDFFYYSFNTLFADLVGGIEPITVTTRLVAMSATVFMGLLFAIVVVFVVTSIQKSKDDDKIDAVVTQIRLHAKRMEPYLGERFGLSLTEAITRLQELGAGFVGLIYDMSPPVGAPTSDQDVLDR